MGDFMKLLGDAVGAEVRRQADARGQLGIGELVALLRAADQSKRVFATVNGRVFGVSAEVGSYRGYYDQLAIEPGEEATAGQLADRLSDAVGETFTGYKGGDFAMSRNTSVWVADYGTCPGWAVTAFQGPDERVLLEITVEEW